MTVEFWTVVDKDGHQAITCDCCPMLETQRCDAEGYPEECDRSLPSVAPHRIVHLVDAARVLELEDERAMMLAERDALHRERNELRRRLVLIREVVDSALGGKD